VANGSNYSLLAIRLSSVKQLGKLRPQFGAQIGADVDHRRERALELHVVRDAGVDQDAIVEIAWQIKPKKDFVASYIPPTYARP